VNRVTSASHPLDTHFQFSIKTLLSFNQIWISSRKSRWESDCHQSDMRAWFQRAIKMASSSLLDQRAQRQPNHRRQRFACGRYPRQHFSSTLATLPFGTPSSTTEYEPPCQYTLTSTRCLYYAPPPRRFTVPSTLCPPTPHQHACEFLIRCCFLQVRVYTFWQWYRET